MTKLIMANLNQGFLADDGRVDNARLTNQAAALAKQDTQLGFMTELPYAKLIQIFRGGPTSLNLICEGGAETVINRVVRDETAIDYDIWNAALKWLQGERDFNTAYIVLSGKMNAYTDASEDSDAFKAFQASYPSLYKMHSLSLVSDLVYQIRLHFDSTDLQNRVQTFNSNFNGKLVAHASGPDIWITAFDASYQTAINNLTDDLDTPLDSVTVINAPAEDDPIASVMGTPDDQDGYAAIDKIIADD
ncbi:HAD hydrolase family protein [Lactobacillus sp. Sy-1]|uniref:HAD hydrolase family protein n=1 Tax=Lactobacillus sp. Sy-1 TaxID=2109645 RepID=UPI001C5710EB|nr:HAD hydrolase family protein [Lactobacillus sp. Sy-1]MBW1605257.1 HAD hydrolase family protein [Lactobacillus sp. Sy-1]